MSWIIFVITWHGVKHSYIIYIYICSKFNNFVNIKFQDLKMHANCSAPLKILWYKLSESEMCLKFQWYLNFLKFVFPHLELFKADFDFENIKQSWLSGQNIGMYAPNPWFKPQQPLPKKKDIFMHLREVYYYINILVSTDILKSGLFTFYNL